MHNQAINSLAFISARYTATAVELASLMCASFLYTVCQALDLRVLQLVFLQSLEPSLYRINRQAFGSVLCDMDFDELHLSVWDHVKVTWLLTSNKDCEDRYTHVIDSTIGVIAKALLAPTLQSGHLASTALEAMTAWRTSARKTIAETFTSVRARFFDRQDTVEYLGLSSRTMYRYVREELKVPLHRGLRDHPEPHDMFAADGSRKRTIGSNISNIYEALRSGAMHKPLIDCLGEGEDILSKADRNGWNGADIDATTAKAGAMKEKETRNGGMVFDAFSMNGEPEPITVEAKRRHSISDEAHNDTKRRRGSVAAVQGSLTGL